MKLSNKDNFWPPLPPLKCLRNIWMVPQEQGYKTNILLAQAKSLEAKHGSQAASSQLLQR